jgi:hypothetical protein
LEKLRKETRHEPSHGSARVSCAVIEKILNRF